MRRVLAGIALLVIGVIVLPPLYYRLVGEPPPSLPPAGRRIQVADGVSVNALERGSGPAVVLVHGLPGTGYNWEAVAEGLAARGHRVIAYDRVGYGRSDARADDDYTPEANARDLLALLEAEGLEDATVVGWSYGGKTAMLAALADPSRIGRLVLVGSAGYWADPPPPSVVIDIIASKPVLEWMASVPPVFQGLQQGMGAQFFSDQSVPDWFVGPSSANFALEQTRDTWREEGARFRFDGPDPSTIALPILIVHGDDDRIIPLVVAEEIHDRAPNSELVVIEGGSHALPATHPAEFSDLIASFAAGDVG